ncbi:hypothetical protein FACS189451_06920 [Bacteroidia bacterium]|nr:hypothetical protein FACS189451_06920 [Bacteroidia bacterium]
MVCLLITGSSASVAYGNFTNSNFIIFSFLSVQGPFVIKKTKLKIKLIIAHKFFDDNYNKSKINFINNLIIINDSIYLPIENIEVET